MTTVCTKASFIALVVASAVVMLCYFTATFTQLSITSILHKEQHTTQSRQQEFTEWTSTSAVDMPNVVVSASLDYRNETFPCKRVVLMNMKFPICHYTPDIDETLSRFLLQGRYFEENVVTRFLRLLLSDRRLQLVDIGANVGIFSLPAARVSNVLAIEPNKRSMYRLAKAVDLGAVSPNITLVHNAVSNVRGTFKMGVYTFNQGNTFLINTSKCIATPVNKPCNTLSPIRTIFLNDLLPLMRSRAALLKVDVEGHEVNVFTDLSAGKFFDEIDIPVVLMEWLLCKRHSANVVQRLLHFFYNRNYTAFDMHSVKLKTHYFKWPGSVVFKKTTNVGF